MAYVPAPLHIDPETTVTSVPAILLMRPRKVVPNVTMSPFCIFVLIFLLVMLVFDPD